MELAMYWFRIVWVCSPTAGGGTLRTCTVRVRIPPDLLVPKWDSNPTGTTPPRRYLGARALGRAAPNAVVAQGLQRNLAEVEIGSSILPYRTERLTSGLSRWPFKPVITGSNPVRSTTRPLHSR